MRYIPLPASPTKVVDGTAGNLVGDASAGTLQRQTVVFGTLDSVRVRRHDLVGTRDHHNVTGRVCKRARLGTRQISGSLMVVAVVRMVAVMMMIWCESIIRAGLTKSPSSLTAVTEVNKKSAACASRYKAACLDWSGSAKIFACKLSHSLAVLRYSTRPISSCKRYVD